MKKGFFISMSCNSYLTQKIKVLKYFFCFTNVFMLCLFNEQFFLLQRGFQLNIKASHYIFILLLTSIN